MWEECMTLWSWMDWTVAIVALLVIDHSIVLIAILMLRILILELIKRILKLLCRWNVVCFKASFPRNLRCLEIFWLLQSSLLVFNALEGILIILDIHILEFILAQVLLLDVFHDMFFMPLAFLVFNGHAAPIHVLGVLLFNFAGSSLVVSPWLRPPSIIDSILIGILISLVFNVVVEIVSWHVMEFLCS